MKDLLGKALLSYFHDKSTKNPITETSVSEADELPLSYFFRNYETMPVIEQKALELAKGKVLDIGAGAGSHSLYLQNEKGLHVTAIDISKGACEVCRLRGITHVYQKDMFFMPDEKFDTILLLMNGTGICGTYSNLPAFLIQLKSLLKESGQILIDSSDIIYMFDKDDDGGVWIPGGTEYYGELTFQLHFNNETEAPFEWLYVDFKTLENNCEVVGLTCQLIEKGENYDYLARISLKK
jgi:SAM-dependent methyltransferase